MTALEDLLRTSLHEHATRPRLGDDVAGSAIRGARTLRRRRVAVATVATALAAVAAISAVTLTHPTSAPVVPASPTMLPTAGSAQSTVDKYGVHVDVLEPGNLLRTSDGHVYDLGPGQDLIVLRVPDGWMYGQRGQNMSLLRTDGTSIVLKGMTATDSGGLEQPGAPVFSADGRHAAWVNDGMLTAIDFDRDGGTNVIGFPAPERTFAATWIGTKVVVGQSYGTGCCGTQPARYDVWDPTQGAFVPHWQTGLASIYGPVPVSTLAFANVEGQGSTAGKGCLGRVDGVSDMSITDKVCPAGLRYGSTMGLLAPDGNHLVDLDGQGSADTVMIVDVRTVQETGSAAGHCAADRPLVFEDSTSLLALNTGGALVRCNIDTSITTPVAPAQGLSFGSVLRLVPRVGG